MALPEVVATNLMSMAKPESAVLSMLSTAPTPKPVVPSSIVLNEIDKTSPPDAADVDMINPFQPARAIARSPDMALTCVPVETSEALDNLFSASTPLNVDSISTAAAIDVVKISIPSIDLSSAGDELVARNVIPTGRMLSRTPPTTVARHVSADSTLYIAPAEVAYKTVVLSVPTPIIERNNVNDVMVSIADHATPADEITREIETVDGCCNTSIIVSVTPAKGLLQDDQLSVQYLALQEATDRLEKLLEARNRYCESLESDYEDAQQHILDYECRIARDAYALATLEADLREQRLLNTFDRIARLDAEACMEESQRVIVSLLREREDMESRAAAANESALQLLQQRSTPARASFGPRMSVSSPIYPLLAGNSMTVDAPVVSPLGFDDDNIAAISDSCGYVSPLVSQSMLHSSNIAYDSPEKYPQESKKKRKQSKRHSSDGKTSVDVDKSASSYVFDERCPEGYRIRGMRFIPLEAPVLHYKPIEVEIKGVDAPRSKFGGKKAVKDSAVALLELEDGSIQQNVRHPAELTMELNMAKKELYNKEVEQHFLTVATDSEAAEIVKGVVADVTNEPNQVHLTGMNKRQRSVTDKLKLVIVADQPVQAQEPTESVSEAKPRMKVVPLGGASRRKRAVREEKPPHVEPEVAISSKAKSKSKSEVVNLVKDSPPEPSSSLEIHNKLVKSNIGYEKFCNVMEPDLKVLRSGMSSSETKDLLVAMWDACTVQERSEWQRYKGAEPSQKRAKLSSDAEQAVSASAPVESGLVESGLVENSKQASKKERRTKAVDYDSTPLAISEALAIETKPEPVLKEGKRGKKRSAEPVVEQLVGVSLALPNEGTIMSPVTLETKRRRPARNKATAGTDPKSKSPDSQMAVLSKENLMKNESNHVTVPFAEMSPIAAHPAEARKQKLLRSGSKGPARRMSAISMASSAVTESFSHSNMRSHISNSSSLVGRRIVIPKLKAKLK